MNSKKILIGLLSLPVYAGVMGNSQTTPWVATFSIGPTWTNPGTQQTLQLTPELEKTYTAFKPQNTLADGELFLGFQKDLSNGLFAHLGLAGALTSQASLSGQIWDDANPEFNNYQYGYLIQHGQIALKAKVFKDTSSSYLPWVSGSVGIGFNRANSYENQPLISEAVMQNNFANYTDTSFTYTVGAGIQKIINAHWQAGVGYEFADWGQSHLNPAQGQTIGYGLSLDHLYTNGLMFNLTYVG